MQFSLRAAFVAASLAAAGNVFALSSSPALDQHAEQLLHDRLFQTNLRGPRWIDQTWSLPPSPTYASFENQNTLTSVVASSMEIAGLNVGPTLVVFESKAQNGTTMGLPTTGYWPYSGDSGLRGVTGAVHDAGSFALFPDQTANADSLDWTGLPSGGNNIVFFDNPSPTRNYSEPGSSVAASAIPEGVVTSWVHTSDENGALQFLPSYGAPGNGSLFDVPALFVGNSTEVESATVVLDAPSSWATSSTVIGHLAGKKGSSESILVYTHTDGPSIIEENGPILLLAMAEYFAAHPININIDFVLTTGHMSGQHLNESRWMDERPALMQNAKAAIVCEHFGAMEWKDNFSTGKPVYEATGKHEPMWTMVNSSSASNELHQLYLEAFEGTPDTLRMAMVSPQVVNGAQSNWYGAGGSRTLGYSNIPTIGIIPQPDYLWAAMPDGGWSKLDVQMAITQINVILKVIDSLDQKFVAGSL
ncbi:elongation factor 2 [Favolaschia claudopus]|uniref:Elongation factor 2 n=1 Tax=Favolaschia claudopus TaxID=2862362 RepID=A0AAV9Z1G7_9AGAR